jgi:hypothetical protein
MMSLGRIAQYWILIIDLLAQKGLRIIQYDTLVRSTTCIAETNGVSGSPAQSPRDRSFSMPKLKPIVSLAALALAGFVRLASASDSERPPGSTVVLPPLLVQDELPWRYAQTGNVEALSRCADRVTKKLVGQFFLQRDVKLPAILPASLRYEPATPTTLILITPEMVSAMNAELAKVMRIGSTDDRSRSTSKGPFSVTYHVPPQMNFFWDESTMMMFQMTNRNFETIALDLGYIASLLERRTPALPYWFSSATFQLYRQIDWSEPDALVVPPVSWPSRPERQDDGKLHQVHVPLMPMREFFGKSLNGSNSGTTAELVSWRAQGDLFLRWALFDDSSHARRDALWKFVDLTSRGSVTEEAFRQCFGLSFADIESRLADYLPVATRPALIKADVGSVELPDIQVRDASEAEIARIRGEFTLEEVKHMELGSPYAKKYLDQAGRILLAANKIGMRDPGFLSVLGRYYRELALVKDAEVKQAVGK